ncbi:hypothetical protein LSTR_LSTR005502 [Laodelphax striatellus]|uniref:Uncharacterized protein n=1 Tax=Laodelphax striatellus TaxID=195883 RepID=A0A482WY88_LAOST|nr:hypothetical protein LSTR_LSTR005502 [Laodelphax striatellus]
MEKRRNDGEGVNKRKENYLNQRANKSMNDVTEGPKRKTREDVEEKEEEEKEEEEEEEEEEREICIREMMCKKKGMKD